VFYSFGGCLLLLSFFKGSLYRQLSAVCYVTVFDAVQVCCTASLASLSSVRQSVCNECIVAKCMLGLMEKPFYTKN